MLEEIFYVNKDHYLNRTTSGQIDAVQQINSWVSGNYLVKWGMASGDSLLQNDLERIQIPNGDDGGNPTGCAGASWNDWKHVIQTKVSTLKRSTVSLNGKNVGLCHSCGTGGAASCLIFR